MDPSGGDLPCSTLPRFLCGAASLAAGRGLGGAGDVLCLVSGGRHLSGAVEIVATGFPGINFQKMAVVLTSPRIIVS